MSAAGPPQGGEGSAARAAGKRGGIMPAVQSNVLRIVVAPDSFKESLSARAAADAIAQGILDVLPQTQVLRIPMADGGEGSLDAVLAATQGERRSAQVRNANGDPIMADWGWLGEGRAFIEMATAAGLAHIAPQARCALHATSFGVGQLILHALDAGARHVVLGLGGSACNDAGAGLLQALGARLLDCHGQALPVGGAALADLATLDVSGLDVRLRETRFSLAVDVDNVLCGPAGASAIFGPQKGASPQDVARLDAALTHFADVLARQIGVDARNVPGMGAAGGLGLPLKTLFAAEFQPGVELIAELADLDAALQNADLVFTGEGSLDHQTLLGKTPAGVARYAHARGIAVIVLAGRLGEGYQALYAQGITAAFSLVPGPVALADAYTHCAAYLRARAGDVMRLWVAARHH